MKHILQTEIDTAHDAGQALSEEVSQHNYYISSHFCFVIEIHIGLFRNWNIVTLKRRPGRGEFFVGFPLWCSWQIPKSAALGCAVPSPRAAATRMPFLGCVCLFSYVQVLGLYAIQKVTRKKGNSYSEFSTPLTSPPTGDANSYKLITYKTLQYVQ